MSQSLRDAVIAAMQVTAANTPREIKHKQWGTLYARYLTVGEVGEIDDDPNDKTAVARRAARVICDKDGVLLFDPDNKDDVALLVKQPWPFLQKVLKEPDDSGN